MKISYKHKKDCFNFVIYGECKHYGYLEENNHIEFSANPLKLAIPFIECYAIANYGEQFSSYIYGLIENLEKSETTIEEVYDSLAIGNYEPVLSSISSDYALRYIDSTILIYYKGYEYSVDFNDITEEDCIDYFNGGNILLSKIENLFEQVEKYV